MAILKAVQSRTDVRHDFDQVPQIQRQRPQGTDWCTTDQACAYLQFAGKHRRRSLYRFLQVHGVPVFRRSTRTILIDRADLDAALRRPKARA